MALAAGTVPVVRVFSPGLITLTSKRRMTQITNKFTRWDPLVHEAKHRCRGHSAQYGTCPYLAEEESYYCVRHGGGLSENAIEKEAVRNYHLTKWQARVHQLADNESIKSLREEVGILRMVLENMLNQCQDEQELLMFSSRAADLVIKIEKLVVSCDRMEGKMGQLLGKDSVLRLAAQYVEIIHEHIDDTDIIDIISTKMIQATVTLDAPERRNPMESTVPIDLSQLDE